MLTDRRCHFLHVSDNDVEHRLLVELIQKTPTVVLEHAKSAKEALDLLRRSPQAERPNLIMLDWVMPGPVTGDELLGTFKNDKNLRSIPVLVFTSSLEPYEIDRIYGLGASCVVHRSFESDKFAFNVERIYGFWSSVASLPYCDPAKPAQV